MDQRIHYVLTILMEISLGSFGTRATAEEQEAGDDHELSGRSLHCHCLLIANFGTSTEH